MLISFFMPVNLNLDVKKMTRKFENNNYSITLRFLLFTDII